MEVLMSGELTGGCQCGAVRYVAIGEPLMTAICHCTRCRRANAAPAVGWALFTQGQVQFTGAEPKAYESSPGVQRRFCGDCGTQICFEANYLPGLIDLTLGSLDQPERAPPQFHYWESRRLSWLVFGDELPRHPEFPPAEAA
jgi:hypothetical protein